MQKIAYTAKKLAVISLIFAAFLNALMGVWVRILSQHFKNFQQIAARAILGSIIGLVLYSIRHRVHFSKLLRLPKRDLYYLFLRSLSLLAGIGMFTFAITRANFSNINMIYALPSTAILGILLLKEKMTNLKLSAILIGFLGVIFITVKDFSHFSAIGIGEFVALISTFFYSLSYITRKYISKALSNQEIAYFGSFITGIGALLISFLLKNPVMNFLTIEWGMGLTIFAAGSTFILLGILNNFGFEHIEAIVANNLLILNSVFGLTIGIVLYKEFPTFIGLVGGGLVIFSAILINYSDWVVVKTND